METSLDGVWTSCTPIRQGAVTTVDLPHVSTGHEAKAPPATFNRVFDDALFHETASGRSGLAVPRYQLEAVKIEKEDSRDMNPGWLTTRRIPPPPSSVPSLTTPQRRYGQFVIWPEATQSSGQRQRSILRVSDPSETSSAAQDIVEAHKPAKPPVRSSRDTTSPSPARTSSTEQALTSSNGIYLSCEDASIRRSEVRTRWFHSSGDTPIRHPPVLSKDTDLRVGDLFLYTCCSLPRKQKAMQIWLLVQKGDGPQRLMWEPLATDDSTYHPVLPDHILSFTSFTTPTWVLPNTKRRHNTRPTIITFDSHHTDDL
ncbi:hypothetical protein DENSPDRAFT_846372 [Dentipellis sp. KUC8613]|nr:hypothetical protein DENSPDRAFT_846372 [Dentipellis sp. KUC8613]